MAILTTIFKQKRVDTKTNRSSMKRSYYRSVSKYRISEEIESILTNLHLI